jgi:FkbM family methyltransferase
MRRSMSALSASPPLADAPSFDDAMTMWRYLRPLAEAAAGSRVSVAGARVTVPGPLAIRLSVVASNIRLHRLMDAAAGRGATIVDVGANTGYNTVYAAALVGPAGRVIAIEPAADNVRVLRDNIAANHLANVAVHAVAAGRTHEVRDLFLRGDVSAVNSLFPESVYATVTAVDQVPVVPLDALVEGDADLVKIDVEGAELDVLGGMTRLLRSPRIQLIVEWHPRLQEAAGYSADALPRCLLDAGFHLRAASHTHIAPLNAAGVDSLAAQLRRSGRPVELVAARPA